MSGGPTAGVPAPIFVPDPEAAAHSQMAAFVEFCAHETGRRFDEHAAFQAFSVAEHRTFWGLFLRWSGLLVEGSGEPVCAGDDVETAAFFPGLRLSYAENLLATYGPGDDQRPALTACDESGARVRLTRGELRSRVTRLASALWARGMRPGDRVVAVARNSAEAVVACLASTALGATWSATSPELGVEAVLSRFRPLEPTWLFAHGGFRYHGADRPLLDRLRGIAEGLPSVTRIVSLDGIEPNRIAAGVVNLDTLVAEGPDDARFEWPRFPFNHPLFILFSSGTTGPPKCIVHGAGGTLLEHQKEHRLHSDLGARDKLLFQTSCGWMMWNWQLSALACGTEIVLYDGSVSYPQEDALFRVVSTEGVTVFGTSPAYLQYCRDAGIIPRERFPLDALRAIQSTGSILFEGQYDWVRDNVKSLPLQSISGGTDIIGCFVLGHPGLPVYRGESQCVSLGLDVRVLTGAEGSTTVGSGELICANPFPSRPLGLHGDPEGTRFHDAYFTQNPGVWTHGDFVELTDRGTARILGRSDGVLNIRGIRIGPAEIYQILQAVPEVVEAMALEQAAADQPGGSRLVLLLVLRPGVVLDRPLTLRIKKLLSQQGSAAHVPAAIAQVDELPTTHSGKRSEKAARDVLNGRPVKNLGALRNPGSLEVIAHHPALTEGQG